MARLPTSEEWMFAARGGATTRFHWGTDESKAVEYEWYADNSNGTLNL